MRNLRNLRHTAIKFAADEAPLTATAWDGTSAVCSFGPTEHDAAITLKRFLGDAYSPEQATTITSWDAPSPNPDLAYDRILSLHCFPDTGTICLVLEGGDIIVVREDAQPGEDVIEIVGSVDAGISAAAWSPDEELLLIATKADTLLFMTRDFEGTATVTLSSEDLKVSNHVSVGWGKRETQFQGRGAKALRDPTVPEHVDEGRLSEFDDARVTISWRGDGQFVAINSILEDPVRRRIIRVYSREGILDSVSEPVDGLEGALSWKPSGQLIAGIQRQADRIDVVFFERNGLRHGEFQLRLSKEEMETVGASIELSWNNDSSVIAVSMRDRVQLWTMGNYHYYLKQEILLDVDDLTAVTTIWHAEKPLQLACSTGSRLSLLTYTFEVSRGSIVPPYDTGAVAVIDGRRLKITPLRTANVPPPMAFDEIELPANAVDVAVNAQGTKIAVLHASSVSLWSCNYSCRPAKKAKHLQDLSLGTAQNGSNNVVRQVIFVSDDSPTILMDATNQQASDFLASPFGPENVQSKSPAISSIFTSTNHDRILYQASNGAIRDLHADSANRELGSLPTACPNVDFWSEQDTSIIFGLTAGGLLHVQSPHQKLKVPGCTSFIVTKTHLIYTTSQHLLKFVHLHDGELEIPPDEPEKDERCRSIERGAKLVTVMPSAYSLVLQMPRGNLETIYPRALVLAGIRHAIGQRDYKKAFLICRTHRVDMNILHDYAPHQFMSDIALFIKQVKKVEYVDLFLSSLSDQDVTKTLYQETLNHNSNCNSTANIKNSNSAEPCATIPNASIPNASNPYATNPNAADPNAANPNAADPNAANAPASNPTSSSDNLIPNIHAATLRTRIGNGESSPSPVTSFNSSTNLNHNSYQHATLGHAYHNGADPRGSANHHSSAYHNPDSSSGPNSNPIPGDHGSSRSELITLAQQSSSKTNRICTAFLQVLSGQESTHLQNIVTAHVSKSPPDLEAGLSLIAILRGQGKQEQLEQAVEHICFLADVNRLYDTALGIYDLDVALLVAQQSQKDPREYLPYLQKLHDMPRSRQRHAIDDDLKRYPKALEHLHALGDFDEVKSYAVKHELFSVAIELYRYDNPRLVELMRLYAESLSSRNRYKEAGVAFEYIGDYAPAYEAYRSCSMWRECLSCAGLMGMSEEKTAELARDLADGQEEAKDFVSAAMIHAEYLLDVGASVRLLCRAYQYSDAIRQVAKQRRPELLRELVDPGLIEGSATMTEMLAEMKSQMLAQVPRLRDLRKKKAEDPMGFLDGGDAAGDGDVPDNISLAPTDTTTAGTFMTRYTNRSTGTLATNATRKTSKNRRREERKRARGKKGTVYEEEYLVNSIARLMERLNATGEDVVRLVEGLMRRGMRERAVAVDRALHDVVDVCRSSVAEVFVAAEPTVEMLERPWGGEGVAWESATASAQGRQAPVLREFERLAL